MVLKAIRNATEFIYLRTPRNLAFYDVQYPGILTKCWLQYYCKRKRFMKYSMYVTMVDLNGLKTINDHYGHYAGDNYIRSFIGALKHYLGTENNHYIIHRGQWPILIRWGGDEFIILSSQDAAPNLERMKKSTRFSFAYGSAYKNSNDYVESKVVEADDNMYAMKSEFYRTHKRGEIFSSFI